MDKKIKGVLLCLIITGIVSLLPVLELKASSISISSAKETIYEGKSVELYVIGSKDSVIWTSANEDIATVDNKGVVTGIKKGTVRITASCNYEKVSCMVTVKKVTISDKEIEIKVGDKHTIKLKGADIISCSSQNTKVAKISKKGIITATGSGETMVKVKASNGKTYKCTVIVPDSNKPELPKTYKKLIKLVKKNGREVEGTYVYQLYVPLSEYWDYYVEYNPDTDIIEFWSYYGNGDEIVLVRIDPYDLTMAQVECSIHYYRQNQDVYADGYIEINTYDEGEDSILNIEGKVDGYTKKELRDDIRSKIWSLLISLKYGLHYDLNIEIQDLGFKGIPEEYYY